MKRKKDSRKKDRGNKAPYKKSISGNTSTVVKLTRKKKKKTFQPFECFSDAAKIFRDTNSRHLNYLKLIGPFKNFNIIDSHHWNRFSLIEMGPASFLKEGRALVAKRLEDMSVADRLGDRNDSYRKKALYALSKRIFLSEPAYFITSRDELWLTAGFSALNDSQAASLISGGTLAEKDLDEEKLKPLSLMMRTYLDSLLIAKIDRQVQMPKQKRAIYGEIRFKDYLSEKAAEKGRTDQLHDCFFSLTKVFAQEIARLYQEGALYMQDLQPEKLYALLVNNVIAGKETNPAFSHLRNFCLLLTVSDKQLFQQRINLLVEHLPGFFGEEFHDFALHFSKEKLQTERENRAHILSLSFFEKLSDFSHLLAHKAKEQKIDSTLNDEVEKARSVSYDEVRTHFFKIPSKRRDMQSHFFNRTAQP